MSGAGKGDARRPAAVSYKTMEERWAETFGDKPGIPLQTIVCAPNQFLYLAWCRDRRLNPNGPAVRYVGYLDQLQGIGDVHVVILNDGPAWFKRSALAQAVLERNRGRISEEWI